MEDEESPWGGMFDHEEEGIVVVRAPSVEDITEGALRGMIEEAEKEAFELTREYDHSFWSQLPRELWLRILYHLVDNDPAYLARHDTRALYHTMQTCKWLSQLALDEQLWRWICADHHLFEPDAAFGAPCQYRSKVEGVQEPLSYRNQSSWRAFYRALERDPVMSHVLLIPDRDHLERYALQIDGRGCAFWTARHDRAPQSSLDFVPVPFPSVFRVVSMSCCEAYCVLLSCDGRVADLVFNARSQDHEFVYVRDPFIADLHGERAWRVFASRAGHFAITKKNATGERHVWFWTIVQNWLQEEYRLRTVPLHLGALDILGVTGVVGSTDERTVLEYTCSPLGEPLGTPAQTVIYNTTLIFQAISTMPG